MSLFLRCDSRRVYPSPGSCPWNFARLGRDLVVDLEPGLLGRRREATGDPLRHARHEDTVPEPLPALPRVMYCNDRPAVGRRARGMEQLSFGQPPAPWMHCRDRCFVLLLRATSEPMDHAVRHVIPPIPVSPDPRRPPQTISRRMSWDSTPPPSIMSSHDDGLATGRVRSRAPSW